jgi:hypothetical protein
MNWAQVVVEFLLPTLATLLLAVLLPVVRKFGAVLTEKVGVEKAIRTQQMLETLAIEGIHSAAETARNALRRGGPPVGGAQKLELALAYMQERLQMAGVVDIGAARLRELIEAKLHLERPELEELQSDRERELAAETEVPGTPAVQ